MDARAIALKARESRANPRAVAAKRSKQCSHTAECYAMLESLGGLRVRIDDHPAILSVRRGTDYVVVAAAELHQFYATSPFTGQKELRHRMPDSPRDVTTWAMRYDDGQYAVRAHLMPERVVPTAKQGVTLIAEDVGRYLEDT